MKRWLSGGVGVWFLVSFLGCLSTVAIEPGWGQIKPNNKSLTAYDITLP